MSAKGKLHGDFDVPIKYVGELVAASLRDGWKNLTYNDLLLEILADQNKSKNLGGLTQKFDFQATVRWKEQGERIRVMVEVLDREKEATEKDCQQMAHSVLKGLADRLPAMKKSLAEQKPRTTYGKARWAELKDLETAGYVTDWNEWKGENKLVLGPWSEGKKIVIPEPDTARHAMICGPTGCGKSSSIFKPNMFERTQVSAIVTEATPGNNPPDLYTTTSGFRQQAGHQIYYFNPDDMASVKINPLVAVTTISKAQEVADLIIKNTMMTKNSGGDPIWETSERHLLTSLLMHFAPEGKDLAAVRSLVREGAEGMGKVLGQSKTETARLEYRGFMNVSTENFRNGVMAGLLQRLRLWVNPRIVALTSKTELDIKALPQQLYTFYLAVPAEKEGIKAVVALIFNFILNEVVLATDPKDMKYPMSLYLDEFTNIGMIPGMARSLTLMRHRKTPIMFGCQDYAQLKDLYGENDAKLFFGQPATRVIFRTPEYETAERVSKMLGKETVVDRKLTSNCQIQEKEIGKDLMTAADVMALDPDSAIFFTPGTSPVMIQRFSWRDYEAQLNVPPPLREPVVVDDDLIKKCQQDQEPPKWEKQWEAEQKAVALEPPADSDKPKPKEETKPAEIEDKKEEVKTTEEPVKETTEELTETITKPFDPDDDLDADMVPI